jgi:hypothetical protein
MTDRTPTSRKWILGLFLLFLILSLMDLFLTWKLLRRGDEQIVESNPFAAWCLAAHGWEGVVASKLGLVAMVGCLALSITRRRPQAGEKLLVFSCGALSTVVVHSIFLGWFRNPASSDAAEPIGRFPRQVRLPDDRVLLLLASPAVREELRLSESRAIAFERFVKRRSEAIEHSVRQSREEWNAVARELGVEQQAFMDSLEPWQGERLRQIAMQQVGHFAFNDPQVVKALEMTDEQLRAVQAVMDGRAAAEHASTRSRLLKFLPARKPEDAEARLQARLLELLTDEQRARWKQMMGEPFKRKIEFADTAALDARTPNAE